MSYAVRRIGILEPSSDAIVRELYSIWDQRRPIRASPNVLTTEGMSNAPQLPWVQSDLELVVAFAKQALKKEEYLLLCDVFEEACVYWDNQERKSQGEFLKELVELRMCYAEARARLGFTRSARNVLEPFVDNPNLGRKYRAKVLLKIGNIVSEESHHTSDLATARQTVANALTIYQKALDLDPDLTDALIFKSSMLLILSDRQAA